MVKKDDQHQSCDRDQQSKLKEQGDDARLMKNTIMINMGEANKTYLCTAEEPEV